MSMGIARKLFIEKVNEILKEAYEEVKRIRKITDDKKRAEEALNAMLKLGSKWQTEAMNAYRQYQEEGELGSWQTFDLGFSDITRKEYEGLKSPYLLLQRIWTEANAKVNQSQQKPISRSKSSSNFSQSKNTSQNQSSTTKLPYPCNGCHQKNKVSEPFTYCSDKCRESVEGELCFNCHKRTFQFQRHPSNHSLTYCLACWPEQEKKLAEIKQIDADWEKSKDDLVEAMTKVASGGSENNQKVPVVEDNNSKNNNNMNNHSGSRESEQRPPTISDLENKPMKTPAEQVQLEELKTKQNNPTIEKLNQTTIYWTVGIISFSLLSLLIFLLMKKKK